MCLEPGGVHWVCGDPVPRGDAAVPPRVKGDEVGLPNSLLALPVAAPSSSLHQSGPQVVCGPEGACKQRVGLGRDT